MVRAVTPAARSPRRSPCVCSSSVSSRKPSILKNPLTVPAGHDGGCAHAALGSYANQFSMLETPRTTCVAASCRRVSAYWCARRRLALYLFRPGRSLIGATKDHSEGPVPSRPRRDHRRRAKSLQHPDRNKIFSCLGGMAEPVIDLSRRTPLRNGDIIVMCTDGLWARSAEPDARSRRGLTSTPHSHHGAADDEGGRKARRAGRRQRVGHRRALGPGGRSPTSRRPRSPRRSGIGRLPDPRSTAPGRSPTARATQRDLTDDEIEHAIEEIQSTIQKLPSR